MVARGGSLPAAQEPAVGRKMESVETQMVDALEKYLVNRSPLTT